MTDGTAKWLRLWCLISGALAAPLLLVAWPPLDAVTILFADIAFWPVDGKPVTLSPEARLFSVIGGGLTIGWMVLLAGIFQRAFARQDHDLFRLAFTSVGTWFVLDSLGSIAVGAWMNAIMNIGILAGFVLPILRDRRETTQTHAA